MKILKNIFKKKQKTTSKNEIKKEDISLSLDELFVKNFIDKGGRFLYCSTLEEVSQHLVDILNENHWTCINCLDKKNLSKLTDALSIEIDDDKAQKKPVFTTCEHLISDTGSILFSSNQLNEIKISNLSDNFIVFAKTSQIVKNMGEGLTGIKSNFKENIPTNICAIKNFEPERDEDNFLSVENSNSKNLYLLLFEDF